jgi:hypothetical protein
MEASMAGREIAVKKDVVRLSVEEGAELEALIGKGKSPAKRLLRARILLKADVSEAGPGWSDSEIIGALETRASMVYRVRKPLVEQGLASGAQPQGRCAALGAADFRRRERSQADRARLLRAACRARPLELATVGGQGGGAWYR